MDAHPLRQPKSLAKVPPISPTLPIFPLTSAFPALPLWEPTRTFNDALERYAAFEPAPPPPYSEPEVPLSSSLPAEPKLDATGLQSVADAFAQLHLPPAPGAPVKPLPQRPRGVSGAGAGAGAQAVMASAS